MNKIFIHLDLNRKVLSLSSPGDIEDGVQLPSQVVTITNRDDAVDLRHALNVMLVDWEEDEVLDN
jgi:hypothetical protein